MRIAPMCHSNPSHFAAPLSSNECFSLVAPGPGKAGSRNPGTGTEPLSAKIRLLNRCSCARPVYRLASMDFDPGVACLHVGSPEHAGRIISACEVVIDRCRRIQQQLLTKFAGNPLP